eukprot:819692-Heterocapsa_arctica.AAC.1
MIQLLLRPHSYIFAILPMLIVAAALVPSVDFVFLVQQATSANLRGLLVDFGHPDLRPRSPRQDVAKNARVAG